MKAPIEATVRAPKSPEALPLFTSQSEASPVGPCVGKSLTAGQNHRSRCAFA